MSSLVRLHVTLFVILYGLGCFTDLSRSMIGVSR